ncbi:MAG TPA: hypothetical protein VFE14_17130 [Micromonosporaceae bacterium]|nr:hypothetical protein [Micromonosporaceae bacterium]
MFELPFDLEHPPDDPPQGVSQVMLWRVAIRLHQDHSVLVADRRQPPTCALCKGAWPCLGRRLAIRGLVAAWRPAVPDAGPTGYTDRFLTTDFDRPQP